MDEIAAERQETLITHTTDIVVSYVSNNSTHIRNRPNFASLHRSRSFEPKPRKENANYGNRKLNQLKSIPG